MIYTGTLSIKYGADIVLEATPAILHVETSPFVLSWAIDTTAPAALVESTPLMQAFYVGGKVDIRFVEQDGEVLSGEALIRVVMPGKEMSLAGVGELRGFPLNK